MLLTLLCSTMLSGCNKESISGSEAAKLLLAEERLDEDELKNVINSSEKPPVNVEKDADAIKENFKNNQKKIEEYQKDVTDPDIVKAALAVFAEKDEKDEAIEKKNKETRAKAKKKKVDEWDDDDELN